MKLMISTSGLRKKWCKFLAGLPGLYIFLAVGLLPPAAMAEYLAPCTAGNTAHGPVDVYVPMDSWIYTALDRLHGLGYLDTAYLGLRPWTKRSIQRMLDATSFPDVAGSDSQALETLAALEREFGVEDTADQTYVQYRCESAYSRLRGISGLSLGDSFHLGQTIANDYGRPYQPGFNTVDGAAGSVQYGRFSLYARTEYQHAPGAAGYSPALSATLSGIDVIPAGTDLIAEPGPIASTNIYRVVEANLSYRVLNHEISFGKSDHWFAPTLGGAFTYSNNGENIYAFQVDRTEPLYIPLLSRLTGSFRYDFFVGSLKGHSNPNDPWLHVEKINFKPTRNLELGFERSVIWGGKGRTCLTSTGATFSCDEPITLHTFLKSFFSISNVSAAEKFSRGDPGARFASFDFSWRLPWLDHWLTLYSDSMVHDDISPVDAPRHAGVRPGIYLSRVPGIPRLDLRVEGVNTDPETHNSVGGVYLYHEQVELQGYTNKSFIMGDAIGREGKGGEAWLTYHLSPMEILQISFQHKKDDKDFIPQGTTQNSFDVRVVKRLRRSIELVGDVQQEWWKAPLYKPGEQKDTVATFQLTIYPEHNGR
jgi:hypothetical protein